MHTTMFWVTDCLVAYGFASLFLGMLVKEMLIFHSHGSLVTVVAESFLFQAVVNILVSISVCKTHKAQGAVFAAHVQQQNHNFGEKGKGNEGK